MSDTTQKPRLTMAELQLQLIMILPDQKERQDALKEWITLWDIRTLRMKG